MRVLFELDLKDYEPDLPVFSRPSVRAVIIRGDRVAMVHSRRYNYYKFPGGGIDKGETHADTLIRETREEAGLSVLPDTIREYGQVCRRQRDWFSPCIFEQLNYYYLCAVSDDSLPQQLDDYEDQEGFALEWMDPREAIRVNLTEDHGPKDTAMIRREARVLELLLSEGFFPDHHP